MNKKLIRYLVIMVCSFIVDSILKYYLPQDLMKTKITIIPYIGLMMFNLLNNTIEEDNRYPFALICGAYYSLIYGNSIPIYILLFLIFAFAGKLYMRKSQFTYFEALLIVILTIFTQEIVLYWLMWITNTTKLIITTFALSRLLPTMIFNLVVFNLVYFIYKKLKLEGEIDVYFGKGS